MHWVWLTLGILALGLGVIGLVLPLLPTVPFLLLAAFCFANSSDRMHNWLISHRIFGPPIQDWNRNRAISQRGKKAATASILLVFLLSMIAGIAPVILGIQGVTLIAVLIFIWSRPSA